jgi:hypothetical protein
VQQRGFQRAQRARQFHNRALSSLALRSLFEQHFFNVLKRLRLPLQFRELPLQILSNSSLALQPLR